MIPFSLPKVSMQRIIFHWTAGTHAANATDKKAYHILIEGDATIIKGDAGIDKNSGSLKDGYAAHTLNCNTNSIGVSLCAMGGAVESPFSAGKWPITKNQTDALVQVLTELCKFYEIPVTSKTVLSHAEVQKNLGIKQRNKWDIARLPFGNDQTAAQIGDYIRDRVLQALEGKVVTPKPEEVKPITPPATTPVPEGAQGVVSTNGGNLSLRTGPGTENAERGSIPNGTPLVVLEITPDWLHVQTPHGVANNYSGWVARQWVAITDGPPVVEPTQPSKARVLISEIYEKLEALEKEI